MDLIIGGDNDSKADSLSAQIRAFRATKILAFYKNPTLPGFFSTLLHYPSELSVYLNTSDPARRPRTGGYPDVSSTHWSISTESII